MKEKNERHKHHSSTFLITDKMTQDQGTCLPLTFSSFCSPQKPTSHGQPPPHFQQHLRRKTMSSGAFRAFSAFPILTLVGKGFVLGSPLDHMISPRG
ncbi:hypothetical protein M430DRAFT_201593 [Amorphotheca resinae ATCC 22711]|uniref:Uncharacterized protein n=1 Tax=Amorphotheca resinae ATCC 22711 TaxID=857342 RepID=A0A2T3BAN4_AMORE|nr:hypothetical protein M430DRAFT_201593 [Amorphotheca resinae ATCC 22711]PSS25392.1 hypothetical protein M430DRAFT_201593 [Amorphotheca resinae ATCC 22711]